MKTRMRIRQVRDVLCKLRCGFCQGCMEHFAAIVDRDRPLHVYRVEDGKIIYMEDAIMEMELGRKLKVTEQVVHKNGNCLDNRRSNLEVVIVESLEP